MSRVASVYRNLLRARTEAFRGDPHALEAARQEIRSKFELVRSLPPQPPRLTCWAQERGERDAGRVQELLTEVRVSQTAAAVPLTPVMQARDAAAFLREFVVQAEVNERGNLALQLRPEHLDKELDLPGVPEKK